VRCCIQAAAVVALSSSVASCGDDAPAVMRFVDAAPATDPSDSGDEPLDAPAARVDAAATRGETDGGGGDRDAGPAETPAARVIHWQLNVALPAGLATVARGIEAAFNHYADAPDIFALEECNNACACGDGNNPLADGTCDRVGDPSVMAVIDSRSTHRYRVRQHGTRAIFYRNDRFTQIGEDILFGAATEAHDDFVYCSSMDRPAITQLGVFLRDNRLTRDEADDRYLVVAAVQWFVTHCPLAQLERFEGWKTHAAFGGDAGRLADVFLLSGDFNMYAGQSMWNETPKASWWISYSDRDLTSGSDVGDGKIDLVDQFHHASIDSEWSFPNPASSRTVCYVSGGPDQCRPDYVWGKIYRDSAVFVSSETDSGFVDAPGSLPYGDHRAVRTVVRYR